MIKDFSWLSMNQADLEKFMEPLAITLDSGEKFKKKELSFSWIDSDNPPDSRTFNTAAHDGPPLAFEPRQYHRDTTKAQLEYLSRVIDLKFTEVEKNGELTLALGNLKSETISGYASYPNQGSFANVVDQKSSYFTQILSHEFGHNLGLEHPTNIDPNNNTEGPKLPFAVDSKILSVMSYENHLMTSFSFGVLDFKKLIQMYGVSTSTQGLQFQITQSNKSLNQFQINQSNVDSFNAKDVHGYQKLTNNQLEMVIDDSVSIHTLIGTSGTDSVDLSAVQSTQGSTLTNLTAGVFSLKPSTNKDAYYDFNTQKFVDFNYGPNISRPTLKFYEGPNGSGLGLEKLILTNQKDKVFLGEIFDEVNAGAGNDEFIGLGDQTKLNGGSGMDTWSIGTLRASAAVAKSGSGNTLSTAGKTINFEGVERLIFNDSMIAFDLDGNAGKVAKIIGAVFGSSLVANKEYVGVGLGFMDSGTSYEGLIKIALDFKFGKTPSNTELVKTLYSNVAGNPPSLQEERDYVNLLNSGTFNQTSLSLFAADHALNAQNIGLAGFANTGIEYA